VKAAAVTLPGGVFFALESGAWTGGMAFYDPALPGPAPAAAYLITRAQFCDVAVQEMYREPGTDLPLEEALAMGKAAVGPGRYETILRVGNRDGIPMLTFTCPWAAGDVSPNPPVAQYLGLLAAGIAITHQWEPARIAAYLAACPGVAAGWDGSAIAELVSARIAEGSMVARRTSDQPRPSALADREGRWPGDTWGKIRRHRAVVRLDRPGFFSGQVGSRTEFAEMLLPHLS
jgi:hypothetical protein